MKPSLDERCAELKARMLPKESRVPTVHVAASVKVSIDQRALLSSTPAQIQPPRVSLEKPHSLIKAALSSAKEVGEDYGRLQFRRRGFVDIRVSKSSMRRALKIMDLLFKRLERQSLKVQIAIRERSYYASSRQETYVSDGRERVQITVLEKTRQRENPGWTEEKRYSIERYRYYPSGILTLALDEDAYWPLNCHRRWSDTKGHLVEEYIDEVVSTIQQALTSKRERTLRAEEEKRLELERQRLRADVERQENEEAERVKQLKQWERAWSECERLRAFVARWEQEAEAEHGQIAPGSPADAWRRWAYLAIDRLDPFRD